MEAWVNLIYFYTFIIVSCNSYLQVCKNKMWFSGYNGDVNSELVRYDMGICSIGIWFTIQMPGTIVVWYADHHLENGLVFRPPFECMALGIWIANHLNNEKINWTLAVTYARRDKLVIPLTRTFCGNLVSTKTNLSPKSSPKLPEYCQIQHIIVTSNDRHCVNG